MNPPKAPESLIRSLLQGAGLLTEKEPVAALGVRGYRRDTMGKPGENDVNIYDDALFLCAPGVFMAANGNTDPSRIGWNASIGKEFAMLCPGTWYFVRGAHKQRVPALRQADEDQADVCGIPNHGHFTVWRAKDMEQVRAGTARKETGYFAINIHRGGDTTTSSWGCQTIPPAEFDPFMSKVWQEMIKHGQKRIAYHLMEGPIT